MSLRLLIVDDEQLAIDRLVEFCSDLEGIEVVGTATNGIAAAEAISALQPDLVTLDIQMPGQSGMALACDLPLDARPEIIFVTAFEHYAPDAFDVEAADYLIKPVRFDRFRQAIARARRRHGLKLAVDTGAGVSLPSPYTNAFWIPLKGQTIRLSVDLIEWVEAARDYVLLHTATRSYIYRSSMVALEKELDPDALFRVHRSNFVRLALVERVERLGRGLISLQLRDGAIIPVGPNYTKDVLAKLGIAGKVDMDA